MQPLHMGIAGFMFLLGLGTAFMGYRYLRVFLGIYGFLAAAGATWLAGGFFLDESPVPVELMSLAGGIVGGTVCALAFEVGLFILGALAAGLGAYFLYVTNDLFHPIVIPLLAIIGGVAGLLLRKIIAILVTSLLGSLLIAFGIWAILKGDSSVFPPGDWEALQTWFRGLIETVPIPLIISGCLASAALVFQAAVSGKIPRKKTPTRSRTRVRVTRDGGYEEMEEDE